MDSEILAQRLNQLYPRQLEKITCSGDSNIYNETSRDRAENHLGNTNKMASTHTSPKSNSRGLRIGPFFPFLPMRASR